MIKLAEMTAMVAKWNQHGQNSIPPVQLVLMSHSDLLEMRTDFINALYDGRLNEAIMVHENNLLPGHEHYVLSSPPQL